MSQNNEEMQIFEGEGFSEGEGEGLSEGEGFFIEGEGEGDEFIQEFNVPDQEEEAMAHTTDEEEKKFSESGNDSFEIEDTSSGFFPEHEDHIYALAQHPTLKNIMLSGGGDERVLVWDSVATEKAKNTLLEIKEGFKDSIEYIKFSPDNKYLLITGQGNPIRIYKVTEKDGKPEFEFKIEMETGDDISFVTWHNKANLFLTGKFYPFISSLNILYRRK